MSSSVTPCLELEFPRVGTLADGGELLGNGHLVEAGLPQELIESVEAVLPTRKVLRLQSAAGLLKSCHAVATASGDLEAEFRLDAAEIPEPPFRLADLHIKLVDRRHQHGKLGLDQGLRPLGEQERQRPGLPFEEVDRAAESLMGVEVSD
ncbi:MAG: hypothetical protein V9E99_17655 [Microthrixaceae bacterium]